MKTFYLLVILLSAVVTCKQSNSSPPPCNTCDIFSCKVNGEEFAPSGPWKSNPLNAYTINGKKTLIIDARSENQFVGLFIKSEAQIEVGNYNLSTENIGVGNYSKENIKYNTNLTYTGSLAISDLLIDGKRVIRGRFSFRAIDSLSRAEVEVNDGFFQVLLKDY
jgi:hypothetical protein